MSEQLKELYTALAKAQGQIEGAAKERRNDHFKSTYADLASVWDAIRAPLSANGLCVIQLPEPGADGKMVLRSILAHTSGASIETVYPLNPTQMTPQGYGSAITYARRYTLMAITGVAPEDDDGNEASGIRTATQTSAAKSQNATGALPATEEAVATLSKADARALFSVLEAEFLKLKTVTDLDVWWVGSKQRRFTLPDDWKKDIGERFAEHKRLIVKALADRHGIPADQHMDAAQ